MRWDTPSVAGISRNQAVGAIKSYCGKSYSSTGSDGHRGDGGSRVNRDGQCKRITGAIAVGGKRSDGISGCLRYIAGVEELAGDGG